MENEINHIDINRKMWNLTSEIYQENGFDKAIERVKTPDFTTFDETEKHIFETLIDVKDMNVIQIGCNNGTEIIYLKKIGANRCVGLDISEKFIEQAEKIASASGQIIEFECSSIYDVQQKFYGQFDLVYITVGVLGWMPNIKNFFEIINNLLSVGGQVFIYEQHPILGMFNPVPPHQMDASYFRKEPFKDDIVPEYIDTQGKGKAISYWFPYTIADILDSCINNGLQLIHFNEYAKDVSDTYKQMEKDNTKIPMSFTLIAKKCSVNVCSSK